MTKNRVLICEKERAEQDKRERDRMTRKEKDHRILVIHLQITKTWLGGRRKQGEASSNNSNHVFQN